jgi:hypothetical protein
MEFLKERTEAFDDYYPCMRRRTVTVRPFDLASASGKSYHGEDVYFLLVMTQYFVRKILLI